jgi:3-hydroxyacyl-[acyl-carrier-protein] dehydratase
VPRRAPILDPSEYDLNRVIAGAEEIRRYNRQRFEMEQLTAIVFEDRQRSICVGYKDLGPDEFWVRGHMPGTPLMPGVIMCEAAAQLASYFAQKYRLLDATIVGFGGLKDVRFRGVVQPGERFVVVARLLKTRSTMMTCEFQCLVRQNLVCEGVLMGIPLPEEALRGPLA